MRRWWRPWRPWRRRRGRSGRSGRRRGEGRQAYSLPLAGALRIGGSFCTL